MEGLPIARRIQDLVEHEAVELAHALADAERAGLGLPADTIAFSSRVKASDGGIDGRTEFPLDAGGLFPLGPRLWQVKSGRTPPRAAREFAPPRRATAGEHKWLVEELRTGGFGYVLFWTDDPVDPVAVKVRDEFNRELDAISPDIPRTFLFVSQIVDLVRHHPGTSLSVLGVPAQGMLAPRQWASSFPEQFISDPAREAIIARIREAAADSEGTDILRVFGDPGVGKSRVVYEAISEDGIAKRTLVATRPEPLELLAWVANAPGAGLVLVVDGATSAEVRSLHPIVAAAAGRIRLITVEDRVGSDKPDKRNLEVPPLAADAVKEMMRGIVPEVVAVDALVQLSGGYPGLAIGLARAVSDPGAGENLARLADRREVAELLRRMVPDDQTRRSLSAIAPFGRVGVDGSASVDLETIAGLLSLDPFGVADALDRHLGRFVTRAGRYRRISPDLVAIWLTDDAIASFGLKLVEAASGVPPVLAFGLFARLETATGSAAVPRFVEQLLAAPRFRASTLSALDDLGARLISVASVVHPGAAIEAIEGLLGTASPDDIRMAGAARTDLVFALEELLWSEPTFERAVRCLFALARAEPESNGWGARSLFRQVFQLLLGGTPVSYTRRLDVARALMAETDDAGRTLIADALGNAFDLNYTRGESRRGRVTGRADWLPQTERDAHEARESAWELLVEIAAAHDSIRQRVGSVIAGSLRCALAFGLGPLVDRAIREIEWEAATRGRLLHELRLLLDFDQDLSREARVFAEGLVTLLEGHDFASRLAMVLESQPHEVMRLRERGEEDTADLVERIAADMKVSQDNLTTAVAAASYGHPLNVEMLFRRFGLAAPDGAACDDIAAASPPPVSALIGFIGGRDEAGDAAWVDDRVGEWSTSPILRPHLPALIRSIAPSDARANAAIAAVEDGDATAQELSSLLYGARAAQLSAGVVARLAAALASGDPQTVGNGLGILSQWLERVENKPTAELTESALRLVDRTLDEEPELGAMGHLVRALVLRKLPLTGDELLPRVVRMLHRPERLDDEDLGVVDHVARLGPDETTDAIVDLVIEATDAAGSRMWSYRLSEAKLASRLAAAVGVDRVVAAIAGREPRRPEGLFDHVAVGDSNGGLDPLFAALLRWRPGDEAMRAAAARSFMMSPRVYWGSYSRHLHERAVEATRLSREPEDPVIQNWATWVSGLLTAQSEIAKRGEEEEPE